MIKGTDRYKIVYQHLWKTYGTSWEVRLSYILHILTRICKLILVPISLSLIISRLSEQDFSGAIQAVVLFVFIPLAIGILTPLVKYMGILGEHKIYRTSTGHYFSKLITADLDYFNSNLSGYLTTATRQYVDSCIQFVRAIRDKYMTTILSIVFPLMVITWLDVWLGAVALAFSIFQAIYLLWASRVIDPFRIKSRELYKTNSGRMADIISNILAVRSAAQEDTYAERIRQASVEESEAFKKRFIMQTKLVAAREMITVLFFAVLLLLTVNRMSGGYIDLTTAVLVITYITTILTGIYSLSDDVDQHDDYIDKIIPAFEILNRQNKVVDPISPVSFDNVHGHIQFKNVSFSYNNNKDLPVFKSFSLKIPQGQKVGIVGLSGAGKSTFTKLLLRFNDVDSGQILIDNIDIRKVVQTDLRKAIAYVPQEPLLFHTSIRENVLLSRPEASEKDIAAALETAHAAHFVNQLSDGISSIVGERGVKLSGGQKQRIAIARAVLQNAPIIILDEATSALDSESEQIIKSSFSEILKNKTAIVIAHRLSTLSEMDRIIVIEKGELAEDGTHDSLVKKENGIYAKLWKRQQRNMEV